ncbi:MAG: MMPL family transporter [Mycobacteriales bacterium]
MTRLTDLVLRHRLLVALAWLALTVAGVATVRTTTGRLTHSFALPGQSGVEANNTILAKYHADTSQEPDALVVTLPAGRTVDSPGVRDQLGHVLGAAHGAAPGTLVVSWASTGDRAFVTRDGRSTYALAWTPPSAAEDPNADAAPALERAVRAAAPPGWRVAVTGIPVLASNGGSDKGNGLLAETLIGAAGALAVLLFVFASFLAVLPLVIAAVSILTTFLLILLVTTVTDVNFVAQFLVGLIGLGVAIDYALLVVTRWREERAQGHDAEEAVRRAMEHAGRAVVFSGLTVTVGLSALIVLPIPALRSIGYAGALIPLVSVVVAVTLLPVLLATVGRRLDWPRIRTERTASRGWTAWARGAVRWRWPAAVAGLAVLALLALPVLKLQLGEASSDSLASAGPARAALDTLRRGGVPSGALTPIQVLVRRDAAGPATTRLAGVDGVHAVVDAGAAGGTRLLTVLPARETSGSGGQHILAAVRDRAGGVDGVLGVGGSGAALVDFRHATYGVFPWMLVLVALITFLLLARAFRSLLLPLKAVLLNLVSLGAAYGVMVWVWQQGHGSHALWGLDATGSVTVWVPLMVFAFLFGLSMDYEVFLLSRIREAYDRGASTDGAVVEGIGRTGRLVSSAALILFLSFTALSTAPGTDLKVLATGLGAGILADATVVRMLLVPALVSLFGRANWWLPARALRWRRDHTRRAR